MAEQTPERLTEDECWQLIGRTGAGRLATAAGGQADIFPVDYLVHERTLVIRSAPGRKLQQLTRSPWVAFELEGEGGGARWSIVIRGVATRMGDDLDIIDSGVQNLRTTLPGEKFNYVRITPAAVEGRRFSAPEPA